LFTLLSICFLQESPVWLSKTGDRAGAQRVLDWIARKNGRQHDYQAQETEGASIVDRDASKSIGKPFASLLGIVVSRPLLYLTCVAAFNVLTANLVEHGSAYAEPRVFGRVTHSRMDAGWQLLVKYMTSIPVRIVILILGSLMTHKQQLILGLSFGYICGLLLFVWTGGMLERNGILSCLYFAGQYLPLLGNGLLFMSMLHMSVHIYPTVAATTGSGLIEGFGRLGSLSSPFLFELLGAWQNFYYLMISCSVVGLTLSVFLPEVLPTPEDAEAALPLASTGKQG